MRKAVLIFILSLAVLTLAACNNAPAPEESDVLEEPAIEVAEYELAYITDGGDVDDRAANQAIWEGLEKYATDNELTYTYYQPDRAEHAAYIDTIDKAIEQGAKVVICLGPYLDSAVYEVQYSYPGIQFILFDGEPHSADYQTYAIEDNVYAAYFSEEELGFLAGYAAVKEGYTQLGYIGGLAIDAEIDYGYGFIAGAKYAAKEDRTFGINILYHYAGAVQDGEGVQTIAVLWYNSGTEIIFSSGNKVADNLIEVADPIGSLVIGCDIDRSYQSASVITSAIKHYSSVTYNALASYYNNSLSSGHIKHLGVVEDGVALTMSNSKFEVFSEEAYEEFYIQMVLGEIEVPDNTTATSAEKLSDTKVSVSVVE